MPIAFLRQATQTWFPMDKGWDAWFKQTQTATVVVDADNQFDDTNKANNKVTLKIKPTKRLNFDVTDNGCKLLR